MNPTAQKLPLQWDWGHSPHHLCAQVVLTHVTPTGHVVQIYLVSDLEDSESVLVIQTSCY